MKKALAITALYVALLGSFNIQAMDDSDQVAAKKYNFYKTLGVNQNASKLEITRAYRTLAKQYHPDRNPAPEAAEYFKKVSQAYEVLKDEEKRQAYNQGLRLNLYTQQEAVKPQAPQPEKPTQPKPAPKKSPIAAPQQLFLKNDSDYNIAVIVNNQNPIRLAANSQLALGDLKNIKTLKIKRYGQIWGIGAQEWEYTQYINKAKGIQTNQNILITIDTTWKNPTIKQITFEQMTQVKKAEDFFPKAKTIPRLGLTARYIFGFPYNAQISQEKINKRYTQLMNQYNPKLTQNPQSKQILTKAQQIITSAKDTLLKTLTPSGKIELVKQEIERLLAQKKEYKKEYETIRKKGFVGAVFAGLFAPKPLDEWIIEPIQQALNNLQKNDLSGALSALKTAREEYQSKERGFIQRMRYGKTQMGQYLDAWIADIENAQKNK